MSKRILRKPEMRPRTGLPASTMYDLIRRGRFPAPVRLGPRSVGWVEEEVDAWLADRIATRPAAPDAAKVAHAVAARRARRGRS